MLNKFRFNFLILVSSVAFWISSNIAAAASCQGCTEVRGTLANLTFVAGKSIVSDLANMKVTLYPENILTYPNSKGEFIFHEVEPGVHRIEVFSLSHHFDPVFVEVSQRPGKSDIVAYQYNPFSKRKWTIPHPLIVNSGGRSQYFEIKEEFTVISMVKSPYGIMIGVSIFMLWLMKKMPAMEEMSQQADQPAVST